MHPIETGNCKQIITECKPVLPLLLLRYESIATHYTEEPIFIYDNQDEPYEQIFRLREFIPNKKISSFMIYAKERKLSCQQDIFIRHAYWDKKYDQQYIKEKDALRKQYLLTAMPSLYGRTLRINFGNNHFTKVIHTLQEIQLHIEKNLVFHEPKQQRQQWNDIEIYVLFDWGKYCRIWDRSQENTHFQNRLDSLKYTIKQILKTTSDNHEPLEKITLDQSFPLSLFRDLTCGIHKN